MLTFKTYCALLLLAVIGFNAIAGEVIVAKVEGVIGPITAKHMVGAIDAAEAQGAECVVFEIDTPGGLDDSMRIIVKRIMSAEVPVIVYVAPSGSRAASAGAFITISAHVAAMAPGTAIGAAHPVALGGGSQTDSNMAAKVENDAAAYIRSIAEARGHNPEWAEKAVRESVSISEKEALKLKVIDLIAHSTAALLEKLDGRVVTVGTNNVTLKTKGSKVTRLEMNWRDRVLATIANPNLAYLLFMLGLLGIYFELSSPGSIFPGVVGVFALILAFFSFHMLSVNYAGVLLVCLSVFLFILEAKTPTFGVLSAGGVAALFFGSLMLFDEADPALRVSLQVIIPVVLVVGSFFVIGVWLSARAMTRRPVTGEKRLLGQEGDVRTPVNRNGGQVFIDGTHWNAVADEEIAVGAKVEVVQVKAGMTLKVRESKQES